MNGLVMSIGAHAGEDWVGAAGCKMQRGVAAAAERAIRRVPELHHVQTNVARGTPIAHAEAKGSCTRRDSKRLKERKGGAVIETVHGRETCRGLKCKAQCCPLRSASGVACSVRKKCSVRERKGGCRGGPANGKRGKGGRSWTDMIRRACGIEKWGVRWSVGRLFCEGIRFDVSVTRER